MAPLRKSYPAASAGAGWDPESPAWIDCCAPYACDCSWGWGCACAGDGDCDCGRACGAACDCARIAAEGWLPTFSPTRAAGTWACKSPTCR